MADGTEVITIDPDVLRRVAKDLMAIGEDVAGADARITAHPISAPALGLMNAWMVPSVSALIGHTSELARVTAGLATAVGAATDAAAGDFERNEAAITDGIGRLEQNLDRAAGRSILR